MNYREKDIVFENGLVWVLCNKAQKCYTVYISGVTHSTSDSSYALDECGRSIAIARANYLVKRHTKKGN